MDKSGEYGGTKLRIWDGGTDIFKRLFYMNVAIMCRALRQKLRGHYLYYGMSGNTRGIASYYYPEEQDEVKPQVRFCEVAHSNLGANTPIGDGL